MTLPNRDRVEELIAKESEHLSRGEAALAEITHPLERAMLQAGIAHKRDLLSILYDYAARQDKEDKAGGGVIPAVVGGKTSTMTVDELRASLTGNQPPGSPSAEDERALVRLGRCVRDLDAAMREKHYPQNPDNQSAINHLRSRLSQNQPRRVSRADLGSTIERVAKMNLDEFMRPGYEYWSFGIDDFINLLRDLGIEVEDK